MAANAEKDFQDDITALRADIAALTDTVGKLASEAAKAQANFLKDAKKAAKSAGRVGEEAWEETVQLGADARDAAMDAAGAGMATIERQIREKPINAVLIALGVGFLVGLVGRK